MGVCADASAQQPGEGHRPGGREGLLVVPGQGELQGRNHILKFETRFSGETTTLNRKEKKRKENYGGKVGDLE